MSIEIEKIEQLLSMSKEDLDINEILARMGEDMDYFEEDVVEVLDEFGDKIIKTVIETLEMRLSAMKSALNRSE